MIYGGEITGHTRGVDAHSQFHPVTAHSDDVAHWLSSPKREEVFSSVANNITTFVDPSRLSGLSEIADGSVIWKLTRSKN